jgi:hypothetical protein
VSTGFKAVYPDASNYTANTYYYQTGIYAPQIGAGVKNADNTFSGVVMGKDTDSLTGLYGYSHGINTYGLKEDGTAFFGTKSGGAQITIDGTSAEIYGGNGGDDANGMTITLAKLGSSDTAIKLGAGSFSVNYDGSFVATQGKIGGKKGWNVAEGRLYSGSGTSYVELNSKPFANQTSTSTVTAIDEDGSIIVTERVTTTDNDGIPTTITTTTTTDKDGNETVVVSDPVLGTASTVSEYYTMWAGSS